ncbi:DUF3696 domain-containing protein [Capnocytophaga canimorsus]|uniref:AAA family ATPase n=1 Tax=Capnocytophaga canimorsus TaxID=28188 RepID=UPI0037CED574
MVKSINISGFKSLLENYIEFGNLTLLTGLNSSGKSSIIQALLMLEKAYYEKDNVLLENHGSMRDLKNPYQEENIKFDIRIDDAENTIEFCDDDKCLIPNDKLIFPEIIYISANRFGPSINLPIYNNSVRKNKIGKNGENLIQFIDFYKDEIIDNSLIRDESEGNTVLFNIRTWLNIISPNIKFDYNIDKKSDTSYALFNGYRSTNVGFGLSYSLSVIATLLIGSVIKNSLIIIENPEAHLHPRGQVELAKLMSLCANNGNQIIVETHSDHIFDSVRIACKEMEGFNEKVKLHWLELNEKNNSTIISPIISKKGRIDEWPQGFFDQFEINSSKLI